MIARTLKAKFLVFTIFFVGIATGVLVANFYSSHLSGATDTANSNEPAQRAQTAQRDINRFYDYLELDQKQRDEMRRIGEETRHEFQELRKETQPRYQAIQEESRTKIRAVLTEPQRVKYDDFRRRMDERRRNRNQDTNKNDKNDTNDHNQNTQRGQRPN
jgi:hypothetical protein